MLGRYTKLAVSRAGRAKGLCTVVKTPLEGPARRTPPAAGSVGLEEGRLTAQAASTGIPPSDQPLTRREEAADEAPRTHEAQPHPQLGASNLYEKARGQREAAAAEAYSGVGTAYTGSGAWQACDGVGMQQNVPCAGTNHTPSLSV